MKKITVMLSIIVFAVACATEQKKEEAVAESQPAVEEAKDPAVERGLELVAQNDCLSCHKVSDASVGPAYKVIASKYEPTAAMIDTLAGKIIEGGSGNWGTVPMTAHPDLSKEDAQTMVKYIFSLKD